MEKFRFITPTMEYKDRAIEFINEFHEYNSAINGTGGLDRYINDYPAWLLKLESDKTIIPSEERVPGLTYFLVRENDDKIIGMINIRLVLNERLKKGTGHIGYCIRPTERQKGYNKINLYLGLLVCQEHGIKEVLMSCDKHNIASAKTMQGLDGVMIREYLDEEHNCLVQNYTINVDRAIENHKDDFAPYISEVKIY